MGDKDRRDFVTGAVAAFAASGIVGCSTDAGSTETESSPSQEGSSAGDSGNEASAPSASGKVRTDNSTAGARGRGGEDACG